MNHCNLVQPEVIKWDLPSIGFTNIFCGHTQKLDEIYSLCTELSLGVFCITESWLSAKVPDQCISMQGFNTFRRDRQDGRAHGGIFCYISETIPVYKVWSDLDIQHLETIWVTIRPCHMPRDFSHITIAVVYHPPGSNDRDMCNHIMHCVDSIQQKLPNTGFMICGYFNRMKDSSIRTA